MSIASCGLGRDHPVAFASRALHTIRQTAEILNISRATVYRLIGDGRLTAVKVGTSTRVTDDSLRECLAALPAANIRPRRPEATSQDPNEPLPEQRPGPPREMRRGNWGRGPPVKRGGRLATNRAAHLKSRNGCSRKNRRTDRSPQVLPRLSAKTLIEAAPTATKSCGCHLIGDATDSDILRRQPATDASGRFVFTATESPDAYETLAEIGIAPAWGVPIVLRLLFAPATDDLWMAAQAAQAICLGSSPENAPSWYQDRFAARWVR